MSDQWRLPKGKYVLSDDNIADALEYTKQAEKCVTSNHYDLMAWEYTCYLPGDKGVSFYIPWRYLKENNTSTLAIILLQALSKVGLTFSSNLIT